MRPTDHARRAIRRGQILLGALAVVVAISVGVGAAAEVPAPRPGAGTVQAELLQPASAPDIALVDMATPTPARWSTPDGLAHTGLVWADAGLAQHTRLPVVVDELGQPVGPQVEAGDPTVTGLVVGVFTLLICWTLLALLSAWWHARLAARDVMDWTDGWARVEPVWSGRAT